MQLYKFTYKSEVKGSKLTLDQVQEIKSLEPQYRDKKKLRRLRAKDIAWKYGVHPGTIEAIFSGRIWGTA